VGIKIALVPSALIQWGMYMHLPSPLSDQPCGSKFLWKSRPLREDWARRVGGYFNSILSFIDPSPIAKKVAYYQGVVVGHPRL
jgi:hypothetical protein